MCIAGDPYKFTAAEISELAVARITQFHVAAIMCRCGTIQMWISRDLGLTYKWVAAARVLERLRCGDVIDGRLS
jgi:hypothetical protein